MSSDHNFEDLESQFCSPSVTRAISWLTTASQEQLELVLRNHRLAAIEDENEVVLRRNVDELLDYVGLLELAAIAGVIPSHLTAPSFLELRTILALPSLRTYYTVFYPLLLPRLFAARKDNSWTFVEAFEENPVETGEGSVTKLSVDSPSVLFTSFLRLYQKLKLAKDLQTFLDLLDDYRFLESDRTWTGWPELASCLTSATQLEAAVLTPPKSSLDYGVTGFVSFLEFCVQLRILVQSDEESHRVLRSGFWHQCRYWLQLFAEKIQPVLSIIANSLQQPKERARFEEYRNCIIDLTAEKWGRSLSEQAAFVDSP